jgi:hypothetical protein
LLTIVPSENEIQTLEAGHGVVVTSSQRDSGQVSAWRPFLDSLPSDVASLRAWIESATDMVIESPH